MGKQYMSKWLFTICQPNTSPTPPRLSLPCSALLYAQGCPESLLALSLAGFQLCSVNERHQQKLWNWKTERQDYFSPPPACFDAAVSPSPYSSSRQPFLMILAASRLQRTLPLVSAALGVQRFPSEQFLASGSLTSPFIPLTFPVTL